MEACRDFMETTRLPAMEEKTIVVSFVMRMYLTSATVRFPGFCAASRLMSRDDTLKIPSLKSLRVDGNASHSNIRSVQSKNPGIKCA